MREDLARDATGEMKHIASAYGCKVEPFGELADDGFDRPTYSHQGSNLLGRPWVMHVASEGSLELDRSSPQASPKELTDVAFVSQQQTHNAIDKIPCSF